MIQAPCMSGSTSRLLVTFREATALPGQIHASPWITYDSVDCHLLLQAELGVGDCGGLRYIPGQ
jgi:hypothetical protein